LLAVEAGARAEDGNLPEAPSVEAPAPSSEVPAPAAPSWAPRAGGELSGIVAFLSPPVRGGTTPFGAGLGGRAALTLGHVVLGVAVVYYIGGTDLNVSNHALTYGLEVGYDIPLFRSGQLTLSLRPVVGGGGIRVSHVDPSTVKVDVVTTASGRSSSQSSSDTTSVDSAYVEPSLSLVLTRAWQIASLSANALVIPSIGYDGGDPRPWLSYGARLQWGVRF